MGGDSCSNQHSSPQFHSPILFPPPFSFFLHLLPPGAASQSSCYLISISLVDSGGLHSFVLFAPSAEKNPAVPSPLCPAASAILPLKKGSAKLVLPHMYIQLNKTHEGGFLFCEGFAQKTPWRARPSRSGVGAGSRDKGGKRLIRASPGQGKTAGSSPGFQREFKEPMSSFLPFSH